MRGTTIECLLLKDAGDRRLVEAAAAGGATCLVTADVELLRYRGHGTTEFVTPADRDGHLLAISIPLSKSSLGQLTQAKNPYPG